MASRVTEAEMTPVPTPGLLKLAGGVEMDRLNVALSTVLSAERPLPFLVVDLADVTYIRIECLTTLMSEVAKRQQMGLETTIHLPLSRDVRSFIRDWEFPQAFLKGTGVRLRELADSGNREQIATYDGEFLLRAAASGASTDERRYGFYNFYQTREGTVRAAMKSRRFLQYRYWETAEHLLADDPDRYKRAVLDECDRWLDDSEIRAVLRNGLGEYYQYLPSDVIHEAMSNCFRHGHARVVIGVSDTIWNQEKKRDTHLNLVFWDDGFASYEALKQRISDGKGILGSAFDQADLIHYYVKAPGSASRRLYSSRDIPTKESQDWELMLSTLFPGITSDPRGVGHFAHPSLAEHLPSDAALPGRGLANLINGAVNVFGGSVAFRSGEYFMNVKKGRGPLTDLDIRSVYSVKVSRLWPFHGNMVTIRLPLNG